MFEMFADMNFEPIQVPERLWSDYEEGPFKACCVCHKALDDHTIYEIKKIFNQRETLFEIAVCLDCGMQLAQECSALSKQAIQSFITAHTLHMGAEDMCILCGESLFAGDTYSISGLCRSDQLLIPLIRTCSLCEAACHELLSEETRKANDDFIDRTVPGVPAEFDVSPSFFF